MISQSKYYNMCFLMDHGQRNNGLINFVVHALQAPGERQSDCEKQ